MNVPPPDRARSIGGRAMAVIRDPARLAALHSTALLDSEAQEAFDRLTRLASKVVSAPVSVVVLVEGDRQYFKSHVGLGEPYTDTRQTPLTHSFCKHIVLTHEPLVVEDAREHPDFRENPAVRDLGVIAYLGVPLMTAEGHVLGSLCVIDHQPRKWSEDDVDIVTEIARSVMMQIELRLAIRAADEAASAQAALAEQLREREERFRDFAENVREVFWIAEARSSRFIYINAAYEDIWGRTVESLYDDPGSWLEATHPEDREGTREAMQALARGEEIRREFRIVRPDGEVRWLWVRGFPVRDDRGGTRRVVGISEDVTERKRREDALALLAEAGRVLTASLDYDETLKTVARLAVESIADWCVVDILEEGVIRRVAVGHADPKMEEFAREYLRRYPPDPEAKGGVAQVLRTGESAYLAEIPDSVLKELARDEEHLRVLTELGMRSAIVVPMISRGRALGALSLIAAESGRRYDSEDVSFAEQLAARAAIAVDNARLFSEAERRAKEEAALRQAAEAVGATFTVEEVIRQIAQSALEATGADGAFVKRLDVERREVEVVAVAGEKTPPLGSRTPYAGSFTERVVEREQPEIVDNIAEANRSLAENLAKTCGDCSALVVPLLDAGEPIGSLVLLRAREKWRFRSDEVARAYTFGNLAALTFRRLHLFEESERRREELERVTESRARLMRGFSHDVKNPLGAADGNAQLLEAGFMGELSSAQKESVTQIRRSIRRALGLIDDLLLLARAEAGEVRVENVPTDVREAVREVAEEHRAQAEAKRLAMNVRLPREFPVVASDASRVRQILGNLISNAIKYTDEGSIDIAVDLREAADAPGPGRWIAVDISDTGRGIPRGKRHLLFKEFIRLHESGEGGAGIGLAISRRIARALGGEITIDDAPRQGSTFKLWLPLTTLNDRGEENQRGE